MIHQVPNDSDSSRQRKERLQHKITTAAQTFLAKNALLEDRNQFYCMQNFKLPCVTVLAYDLLCVRDLL